MSRVAPVGTCSADASCRRRGRSSKYLFFFYLFGLDCFLKQFSLSQLQAYSKETLCISIIKEPFKRLSFIEGP